MMILQVISTFCKIEQSMTDAEKAVTNDCSNAIPTNTSSAQNTPKVTQETSLNIHNHDSVKSPNTSRQYKTVRRQPWIKTCLQYWKQLDSPQCNRH